MYVSVELFTQRWKFTTGRKMIPLPQEPLTTYSSSPTGGEMLLGSVVDHDSCVSS